jgi:hypothetical protein
VFGCPPQKEKKGKVLLKGGLSAVCCGKEQEENQAPGSAVRSGPNEGKGGERGRKRDRGPSVLLPAAVGKKKSQRERPPVGWKMEKKVGLLSRLLP